MPAPLIVLLPGTDGTGAFFEDLVAHLTPQAEVRVIAYPQSGPQTYEHLGALLLAQMPTDQDYVLVGESFGGPLAVWLAVHAPRPPVRLILDATFAASPFGRLGRWVRPLLWIGEHLPLWTWQIDLMLFNGRNRAWAQRIHDAVRLIPRRVLLDRVRAVLGCDVRSLLDAVAVPVLCLNAARDRLIPPFLPRHFGHRSNLRIVNLDLPHMIFQSAPGSITQHHLLPFVKD
ncbi:hypothetical protein ABI_43300 [Asticcacaulis biprosthecium C19]|uniref:AB hydrolase-1 domain-containing protein n=1 Tax=Asticcacaulis biprosthecium C19 TaxID=715226 RepID=F4QT37_9CAUL|nr:alpha/beta hydrolase [Asticcacaulis biprosthecium]EGF89907.1 hypothetical protein ABI_43300 [Asticcacaulis biprosthecium C19]